MKYRFGLDVGTNSLGWSVLLLDKTGKPHKIEAAGARIFSDGRDEKSKATLAATRRDARSARRRHDRFKQRQTFLLAELTKLGLFPEDAETRKALQTLNPLELRAKALTEKLTPHQIGRALFHLNQRRGFKSNRKDRSDEATSGKVSNSARKLLEEMELIAPALSLDSAEYKKLKREERKKVRQDEAIARNRALEKLATIPELTYGSFLWQRQQKGESTRARPNREDKKLYDVYPTREMYEDEFAKIWKAQAEYHSEIMIDENRKRIHHVIFTQRPLKPQKRGQCTYMNKEQRTYRAMPSFQRYRIYQEVNALEWNQGRCRVRDHRDVRDAIVKLLEQPSLKEKPSANNAQVGFAKMKTVLKKYELAEGNLSFNFETEKRKAFDGNQTSNIMQHEDYVGEQWHNWSLEEQDKFIEAILEQVPDKNRKGEMREQTDDEVKQTLMEKFGLSESAAENCTNAPLVDGTANVSLKAARLMLDKMRDGITDTSTGEILLPLQNKAASAVAKEVDKFEDPFRQKGDDGKYELLDALPYYGEFFQNGSHIIPGTLKDEDKGDDLKYFGGVTNPTVHIALNQIRRVVNELIQRYGHPESIAIELGRELPVGKEGRSEITKQQRKAQEKNEKIDAILAEHKQMLTRDNRLRVRLWEQQDKCCPFSGEMLGVANLFDGSTEIEHLIPFSVSLDDSTANKVVCTRQANRDKGKRTPFDAFGHSPDGYNWADILARVEKLPKSKHWRFQEDALDIWKRDHADFTERHLNDTRYIGRLTREYLEGICRIDKIDVLTGRLTGLLRGHWGLNSVLSENDSEAKQKKNRDDHRHHAVDAIVIGMTSRAILQKVSTEARRAEEETPDLNTLFPKGDSGKRTIDPWDGFRNDVRKVVGDIVVSHKPRRKYQGQLHNETALGIIAGPNKKGEYETVVRRPIDYLTDAKRIAAIRDPKLRAQFTAAFAKDPKNGVKEFAAENKIRSVRCFGPKQLIPIFDKDGNVYKGYQGDSNWGIEIYAFPEGHEKSDKWEGVVISRFEANQHGFQSGNTCRPHPTARLVMRLQINDFVEFEVNGSPEIMRVQLISQSGSIFFARYYEANVDARNRDKDDDFRYISKTANALKPLTPRKVHISPSGKWSYENRRKPRRR